MISTALGGKHPVSHKLEMSARGSSDLKAAVEEEFTIEAVKQLSLQDMVTLTFCTAHTQNNMKYS